MTRVYGVNPVGLKRQPTFEEIINTENFKPKYPDRTYTFLRNSHQMTQFDNMGVFEFDDYYQRERVQRQMHDLLSSIAKSSDLTVGQLNAIIGSKGKLRPTFGTGDAFDMQAASDALTLQQQELRQKQLEKLNQVRSILKQHLGMPISADPIEQLIPGQGSSDVADAAAEVSLTDMDSVNEYASLLLQADKTVLNGVLKETLAKQGIKVNLSKFKKLDKILNIVRYETGYEGPILSFSDILHADYSDGTDALKDYPTFVIDKLLKQRKIKFDENTSFSEKLLRIEMHDKQTS